MSRGFWFLTTGVPVDRPDPMPNPVDRDDRVPVWFILWFGFCALVAVGVVGVAVWAVITLVQWVTG